MYALFINLTPFDSFWLEIFLTVVKFLYYVHLNTKSQGKKFSLEFLAMNDFSRELPKAQCVV